MIGSRLRIRIALCSLVLLALPVVSHAEPPSNAGSRRGLAGAYARAIRAFDAMGSQTAETLSADQPTQHYRAEIADSGKLRLQLGEEKFGIRTVAVGRGSVRSTVGPAEMKQGADADGWPSVELTRILISEQFVNGETDLHHWMQVNVRPEGTGHRIWMQMEVSGPAQPQLWADDSVRVKLPTKALDYSGLKVWDRLGKTLPSHFDVRDKSIYINVDDTGAIYPLTIDPVWVSVRQYTSKDVEKGDGFGSTMAALGDTVLIGAPNRTANSGCAYVFRYVDGEWRETQKLVPHDSRTGDRFADSLALTSDTLMIGAPGKASARGSLYVFARNNGQWTETQEIWPATAKAKDSFPNDISIFGNDAIVGNLVRDNGVGAAFMLHRDADTWQISQSIDSPDISASRFGSSVATNGDTAVIGAFASANGGVAYTYARVDGIWKIQQKLFSTDTVKGDWFGYECGFAGSDLAITAPYTNKGGQVYIFRQSGSQWLQTQQLKTIVLAAGNTKIAGTADQLLVGSGYDSASLYQLKDGQWELQQQFRPLPAGTSPTYHQSVGFANGKILIGEPLYLGIGAFYDYRYFPEFAVVLKPAQLIGGDPVDPVAEVTLPNSPTTREKIYCSSDLPGLARPRETFALIGPGATTVKFPIRVIPTRETREATITVTYQGKSVSVKLTVNPITDVSSFTVADNPIATSGGTTATVKLAKTAGASGQLVNIAFDPKILNVPSMIRVPAGESSFTFPVEAVGTQAASTSLTAVSGGISKTVALQLVRASIEGCPAIPRTVKAGIPSSIRIALMDPAPGGGVKVYLESVSPDTAPLPAFVIVPKGKKVVTIPVPTYSTTGKTVKAVIYVWINGDDRKHMTNITVTP
jgi:FG-GAP repeat